jgi:hypothetical protein
MSRPVARAEVALRLMDQQQNQGELVDPEQAMTYPRSRR